MTKPLMIYGNDVRDVVFEEKPEIQKTDSGIDEIDLPKLDSVDYVFATPEDQLANILTNRLVFSTTTTLDVPIANFVVFIDDLPHEILEASPSQDIPNSYSCDWKIPRQNIHENDVLKFDVIAANVFGEHSKKSHFELETIRGKVLPIETTPTFEEPVPDKSGFIGSWPIDSTILYYNHLKSSFSETVEFSPFGISPYRYSCDNLPEGLSINPMTGEISGKITSFQSFILHQNSFWLDIKVSDSNFIPAYALKRVLLFANIGILSLNDEIENPEEVLEEYKNMNAFDEKGIGVPYESPERNLDYYFTLGPDDLNPSGPDQGWGWEVMEPKDIEKVFYPNVFNFYFEFGKSFGLYKFGDPGDVKVFQIFDGPKKLKAITVASSYYDDGFKEVEFYALTSQTDRTGILLGSQSFDPANFPDLPAPSDKYETYLRGINADIECWGIKIRIVSRIDTGDSYGSPMIWAPVTAWIEDSEI